ncbi:MAG: hypothetical protein ACC652_07830 [Acidimicrobiales bacterium]
MAATVLDVSASWVVGTASLDWEVEQAATKSAVVTRIIVRRIA